MVARLYLYKYMPLSKLQISINIVLWIAITLYLFLYHSVKDVLFFWILWAILYYLQLLVYQIGAFFLIYRHTTRINFAASDKEPQQIFDASAKVFEWDSNYVSVNEFNNYYEQLGTAIGAKTWRDKDGYVNEESARNISSQFIGAGLDPKVSTYIQSNIKK